MHERQRCIDQFLKGLLRVHGHANKFMSNINIIGELVVKKSDTIANTDIQERDMAMLEYMRWQIKGPAAQENEAR